MLNTIYNNKFLLFSIGLLLAFLSIVLLWGSVISFLYDYNSLNEIMGEVAFTVEDTSDEGEDKEPDENVLGNLEQLGLAMNMGERDVEKAIENKTEESFESKDDKPKESLEEVAEMEEIAEGDSILEKELPEKEEETKAQPKKDLEGVLEEMPFMAESFEDESFDMARVWEGYFEEEISQNGEKGKKKAGEELGVNDVEKEVKESIEEALMEGDSGENILNKIHDDLEEEFTENELVEQEIKDSQGKYDNEKLRKIAQNMLGDIETDDLQGVDGKRDDIYEISEKVEKELASKTEQELIDPDSGIESESTYDYIGEEPSGSERGEDFIDFEGENKEEFEEELRDALDLEKEETDIELEYSKADGVEEDRINVETKDERKIESIKAFEKELNEELGLDNEKTEVNLESHEEGTEIEIETELPEELLSLFDGDKKVLEDEEEKVIDTEEKKQEGLDDENSILAFLFSYRGLSLLGLAGAAFIYIKREKIMFFIRKSLPAFNISLSQLKGKLFELKKNLRKGCVRWGNYLLEKLYNFMKKLVGSKESPEFEDEKFIDVEDVDSEVLSSESISNNVNANNQLLNFVGFRNKKYEILFPHLEDSLPPVWGEREEFTIEVIPTTYKRNKNESYPKLWVANEEVMELDMQNGPVEITKKISSKGHHEIAIVENDKVVAKRKLRIVNYREEIISMGKELIQNYSKKLSLDIQECLTPREILRFAVSNDREITKEENSFSKLINIFESATYSQKELWRSDYRDFFKLYSNLDLS